MTATEFPNRAFGTSTFCTRAGVHICLAERGGFEASRPFIFVHAFAAFDAAFLSPREKLSSPGSSTSRSAGPIKGGTSSRTGW